MTLGWLAAIAIAAPPATSRLAILPATVEGSSGEATSSQLFDLVAKSADYRQGLELVAYNALFIDGVEPVARTVRDCGSDVPCIARALRLARIDLGLRVIANFALDPPLITFNLIRSEGDRVIGESVAELAERSLAELLEATTAALLEDAGFPRGGRLAVEVTPLDAAVTVAPPAPGGVIAPGRYRVSAAKEGFAAETREVEIRAGVEEQIRFALAPVEESSIVESPWLWTGVGAAVVVAVVIGLVAADPFSNDPEELSVCIATPATPCD